MSLLYPIKLKPIYKEKVWGGQKIKTVLGKDYGAMSNCGELWAVSGVPGDESVVENGFLAGNNINEIVEIYMDEFLGGVVHDKFGDAFPVLIKFLNSADFLSVQVHPDDHLAKARHQCPGKNEMWYIIDTETDSELIMGFKDGVDKEVYLQKLKSGQIKDIMNYVRIAPGDAFYVPAGKVHAIGKGVLLAEIQQTSDITYRIYDWDRKDEKDLQRELHTELAMDAIDFKNQNHHPISYARLHNMGSPIVETPYFNVNYMPMNMPVNFDLGSRDSFTVFVCVEGSATCYHEDEQTIICAGETIVIPAEVNDFSFSPNKMAAFLEVFIAL